MPAARYRLLNSDEDRKQLYWGAFMFGRAVFHLHRRAGYWLDSGAVQVPAAMCFRSLMNASGQVPYVDDQRLGLACFNVAFAAGYAERAE